MDDLYQTKTRESCFLCEKLSNFIAICVFLFSIIEKSCKSSGEKIHQVNEGIQFT